MRSVFRHVRLVAVCTGPSGRLNLGMTSEHFSLGEAQPLALKAMTISAMARWRPALPVWVTRAGQCLLQTSRWGPQGRAVARGHSAPCKPERGQQRYSQVT